MRPAENIEKLVKKLRYQSSDKRRKRIFDNVAAMLDDKQKRKPAIIRPNIWRIIMKTKITKVAMAAVIIIAVIIGVDHFGVRLDGSSVAWADIAERVQMSKAFIYHMVVINEGTMTVGDQTIDMPDIEMDCI